MRFLPLLLGVFPILMSSVVAEVVVQNLADSGPGSLREAVANAVADEVIVFDPALSGGTLKLESGQIFIRESLTIDASSLERAVILDGGGASRIFRVQSEGQLTLRSLELANGRDAGGGAILNRGPLECQQCTFHGNISTGNTGESGYGGAIFSSGSLSLINCTLTQNFGDRAGGAIHLDEATATLTHCTVVHNGVERVGGRSGGPEPGPGGLSHDPGFQSSGGFRIFNSIVCQNHNEFVVARLEGQNLDPGALLNPEQVGNLIDVDPLLAPLAGYGGPIRTMMPLSLSPVIDGGTGAGIAIDQRGASRPAGGTADIGAVETGALPEFDVEALDDPVVTVSDDRRDYAGSPVGLSLREAIARAQPGAIITFAPGLAGQTLALEHGELVLRREIEIEGDALPEPVTISGSGQSRVFFIEAGATVSLRGLNVAEGLVGDGVIDGEDLTLGGGGIFNAGDLQVIRCLFENNRGQQGGGLTSRRGSRCKVVGSTFWNNKALIAGGGANLSGEVLVEKSTFQGNWSQGSGGGLYLSGMNPFGPEVSNSTFTENEAVSGGGLSADQRHHVSHCTIVGNSASFRAGGISIRGSFFSPALDLRASVVAGNEAPDDPDLNLSLILETSRNFIGGDPRLGALQDNGGPTATMMPATDSPAIDPEGGRVGRDFETDQRGFFRTGNGIADLGAVEFDSEAFPERLSQPVVTSTTDQFRQTATPDPDDLTLREAIAYSAPGAVVTISEDLPGSGLLLTEGELEVPHALTIDGMLRGEPYRLDADAASRHFRVPAGRELTVRNLAFENGRREAPELPGPYDVAEVISDESAGGSIFSAGRLVVIACEFRNCGSEVHGGAVGSAGELVIRDSVFEDCTVWNEGGAIWAYSNEELITISGSRFEGNRSFGDRFPASFSKKGGAVALVVEQASAVIDECYFKDNQADEGGAVLVSLSPGKPAVRIQGSSFFGNLARNAFSVVLNGFSSPGGLESELIYENCSWYGNRHFQSLDEGVSFVTNGWAKSIFNHCTIDELSMRNEIIVQEGGRQLFNNCIVTSVNELEEGGFDPTDTGNYVGAAARLSPPGKYGGRWPTMIPLPGSPALDLGISSELDTDQRGQPRMAGAAPDAGAVERRMDGSDLDDFPALTVRLPGDPLVWDGDLESLSLRHALALARPGGIVNLAESVAGGEIRLVQGVFSVAKAVEVASPAGVPKTRLVPSKVELLEIVEGGELTFTRMEFSGMRLPETVDLSRVVQVWGDLSLRECDIKDNETQPPFFAVEGSIEATESHFEGNRASPAGVCFLFSGASGQFDRCSFVENRGAWAGVIQALPAPGEPTNLIIRSSTFSGNAGQNGGAINSGIPTVIEQSTIVGNEATGSGGGVFLGGSGHQVVNSIISENESPEDPELTDADSYRAGNFVGGDPMLRAPGYFGGPTMTMPPVTGSSVIDRAQATSLVIDQRGQARQVGPAVDFGAVEFQGREGEFQLTFDLDSDGDGVSNGLEQAIGRDPAVFEMASPYDLRRLPDGTVSTGYEPAMDDLVVFRLTRSEDLVDFETVLLSNETGRLLPEDGFLTVEEAGDQPRFFYRVEVTLR